MYYQYTDYIVKSKRFLYFLYFCFTFSLYIRFIIDLLAFHSGVILLALFSCRFFLDSDCFQILLSSYHSNRFCFLYSFMSVLYRFTRYCLSIEFFRIKILLCSLISCLLCLHTFALFLYLSNFCPFPYRLRLSFSFIGKGLR